MRLALLWLFLTGFAMGSERRILESVFDVRDRGTWKKADLEVDRERGQTWVWCSAWPGKEWLALELDNTVRVNLKGQAEATLVIEWKEDNWTLSIDGPHPSIRILKKKGKSYAQGLHPVWPAGPAPSNWPKLISQENLKTKASREAASHWLSALDQQLEDAQTFGFQYRGRGGQKNQNASWALGHALRFLLQGKEIDRQRSMTQAAHQLINNYPSGNGDNHAWTLMNQAFTLDLMEEHWPADHNRALRAFLLASVQAMAEDTPSTALGLGDRFLFANPQEGFQWRGLSSWKGPAFKSGAALAAMALLAHPPNFEGSSSASSSVTLEGERPLEWPHDVPVVPFHDDRFQQRWLINGPFPERSKDHDFDPPDWSTLRPVQGDEMKLAGQTLHWRSFRAKGVRKGIGATFYPREAGVFWGKGTGGGYWSGVAAMEQMKGITEEERALMAGPRQKSDRGDNLGRINRGGPLYVVLHHLMHVERPLRLEARPNWGTGSTAVKVWISGRSVGDGDLVELTPGLHPVTVKMPIFSGYSNLRPRFKEVTPEIWKEGRRDDPTPFERGKVGLSPLELDLWRLLRSLRRFAERSVDSNGERSWWAAEQLLPAAATWKRMSGVDLLEGTGVERLPEVAYQHGAAQPSAARALAMADLLVKKEELPFLAWYRKNIRDPLDRPHLLTWALLHRNDQVEALEPQGSRWKLGRHDEQGVVTWRGQLLDPDAAFVKLSADAGAPTPEPTLATSTSVTVLKAAGPFPQLKDTPLCSLLPVRCPLHRVV